MKILLVCSAGISTSILVQQMKKAAAKEDMQATIDAVSEADLKGRLDQAEVILIGPQVGYLKKQVEKQARPYETPVAVIDAVAYGTMDGAKVLAQAQALLER